MEEKPSRGGGGRDGDSETKQENRHWNLIVEFCGENTLAVDM
jgi:hypothetical protein